jgi:hypothetical protein
MIIPLFRIIIHDVCLLFLQNEYITWVSIFSSFSNVVLTVCTCIRTKWVRFKKNGNATKLFGETCLNAWSVGLRPGIGR